ncbi:hypothetical protein CKM354_000707100 [Cercospora kikuchii]|uniref:Uncharacterized protein n=1 Tax=Cercospora kikuchii TaxID=84275 RepID=A0A9P3CT23_9PEZI|nr:uncharacterized protein CKM354_000707100 [Cercospora kikuchii]GIZ43858.1 hypothetical protein CKM354_000707100 [Cercospora kikuchii]
MATGFFDLPRELRDFIYHHILARYRHNNIDGDLGKLWHVPYCLVGTGQDDHPLRMRQRIPGPSFERLLRISEQFSAELCEELRATQSTVALEIDVLFATATLKLRHSARYGVRRWNGTHPKPFSLDATIAPPLAPAATGRRLRVWSFDRIDARFMRCVTVVRLGTPLMEEVNCQWRAKNSHFPDFVPLLKAFLGIVGPELFASYLSLRTLEVSMAGLWYPITHSMFGHSVPNPMIRCLDLLWCEGKRFRGGQLRPTFFIGKGRLKDWLASVSTEATDMAWVIGCLNYGAGEFVHLNPGTTDALPAKKNTTTDVLPLRPYKMYPKRVFVGPS